MIRPTGFSNRWLRLDEFRALVVAAWDDLKRTRAYEFAVELAKHMRPLFPPNKAYQALERVATANATFGIATRIRNCRPPLSSASEQRTSICSSAGEPAARPTPTWPRPSTNRPVSRTSCGPARSTTGKDTTYQDALVQMTRFINTQPRQRLPLAYVRRGEILMDLGRFDEALDHFERVLAEYPDSISRRSRRCIWSARARSNEIIPTRPCRPGSACCTNRISIRRPMNGSSRCSRWAGCSYQIALTMQVDRKPRRRDRFRRRRGRVLWRPTTVSTTPFAASQEFVARYPKRPESSEARFLLAKALRDRAELPRFQLKRAETDNARKELKAKIQWLLTEAETSSKR